MLPMYCLIGNSSRILIDVAIGAIDVSRYWELTLKNGMGRRGA